MLNEGGEGGGDVLVVMCLAGVESPAETGQARVRRKEEGYAWLNGRNHPHPSLQHTQYDPWLAL